MRQPAVAGPELVVAPAPVEDWSDPEVSGAVPVVLPVVDVPVVLLVVPDDELEPVGGELEVLEPDDEPELEDAGGLVDAVVLVTGGCG